MLIYRIYFTKRVSSYYAPLKLTPHKNPPKDKQLERLRVGFYFDHSHTMLNVKKLTEILILPSKVKEFSELDVYGIAPQGLYI